MVIKKQSNNTLRFEQLAIDAVERLAMLANTREEFDEAAKAAIAAMLAEGDARRDDGGFTWQGVDGRLMNDFGVDYRVAALARMVVKEFKDGGLSAATVLRLSLEHDMSEEAADRQFEIMEKFFGGA